MTPTWTGEFTLSGRRPHNSFRDGGRLFVFREKGIIAPYRCWWGKKEAGLVSKLKLKSNFITFVIMKKIIIAPVHKSFDASLTSLSPPFSIPAKCQNLGEILYMARRLEEISDFRCIYKVGRPFICLPTLPCILAKLVQSPHFFGCRTGVGEAGTGGTQSLPQGCLISIKPSPGSHAVE